MRSSRDSASPGSSRQGDRPQVAGEAPDEELVDRAVRDPEGVTGKRAAAELFERYSGRVYRWCYRYTRNHDEALDLAQDILFGAFAHLASFEGRSRFSWWLFSIARNRCRTAKRPASLTRDEAIELETLPDRSLGPDTWTEWKEEETALMRLVEATLDPVERGALFLRCSEGLPVEEITRLLHISGASGARAVLQSARRKLRKALSRWRERRGGEPS